MRLTPNEQFAPHHEHNCFIAVVLIICCFNAGLATASNNLVEQGKYLFNIAGCAGCHSSNQPLAGGSRIETSFGTFYTPNISPDREHGIGGWSKEEFCRALNDGKSPTGENYFPVFPYTSYTKMTASDKSALWAYIQSQPAIATENRSHDLSWFIFSRKLMGIWRLGNFTPGAYADDLTKSRQWNRGAYLATAVVHCGECHTPRGSLGGMRNRFYLAGNENGPDDTKVPNITQDTHTGIGSWSHQELTTFLATGQCPDGSHAQGLMAEVLATSVMRLTEDDREALATYLLSVPPANQEVNSPPDPFAGLDEF
jgi:mono/diheme cytochrome c family protein